MKIDFRNIVVYEPSCIKTVRILVSIKTVCSSQAKAATAAAVYVTIHGSVYSTAGSEGIVPLYSHIIFFCAFV